MLFRSVYRLLNRGGSGGHLYTGDDIDLDESNFGTFTLDNGNLLTRTMNKTDSYQMNLTLSYARQFGLHNVSGLFSIEKAESEYEYVTVFIYLFSIKLISWRMVHEGLLFSLHSPGYGIPFGSELPRSKDD